MKRTTLFTALLTASLSASAAEFIYQPAGSSNDPQRRLVYDINGEDINDINNDTGQWAQGHGPLLPGSSQVLSSGSAFGGIIHLSELQTDHMCATVNGWNILFGDDPTLTQDVSSNITAPFTLDEPATVKVLHSGSSHFSNASNGSQLFIPGDFSIRSGLTGNGGSLIQYSGTGSDYLSLAAGDYRLTTGVNHSMFCSPFPCNRQSVGGFRFNLEIVSEMPPGSAANLAFVPDQVTLNPNPEQQFVDTDGALIFRGATETSSFMQKPGGWFEINARNTHLITPLNGAIITSLTFPNNLAGEFQINVGDVNLGSFNPDEVLSFADFSALLGPLLLTGSNNAQGVADFGLSFRPALSQQFTNRCGFQNQQAIFLSFDQATVDVDIESSLIQDPVYSSNFE